jgi:drug/metabolite transporter (DMT)-like permease
VAPFEYLRLPFAVFMGWLIWSEMPVIWTYVGAAIVIASALYIAHREHQLARQRRRAAVAAVKAPEAGPSQSNPPGS